LGALLLSLAVFLVSGSADNPGGLGPAMADSGPAGGLGDPAGPVECVIDLDCGTIGYGDYYCDNGYVMRPYHQYECAGRGSRNATCVNKTIAEVSDRCNADEVCTPGKRICQPNLPAPKAAGACDNTSGYRCPSCSNGVMDAGEEGVDCGGPCEACFIECTSNESCGIPRWNPPYCGSDGSVYQAYVTYTCVDPGTAGSYCRHDRIVRRSDYCGPRNRCNGGRCVDDRDREPYAYYDGGFFGRKRLNLSQEYECRNGDSCYTLDSAYKTCVGGECFKIKPIDGEEPGPFGLQ